MATAALITAKKEHDQEMSKQQAKRREIAAQVAGLEAKAQILSQDVAVGQSGTLIGSKIAAIQHAAASTQGSLGELGGKLDLLQKEVHLGEVNTRTAIMDAEEAGLFAKGVPDLEKELESMMIAAKVAEDAAQNARDKERKKLEASKEAAETLIKKTEEKGAETARKLEESMAASAVSVAKVFI